MSQRAIALATRDKLQAVLGLDQASCDVVPPPGKPPALAGELFVGIWEGGFENKSWDSRDDRHRVNVTITRRIAFTPEDRQAQEAIHSLVIGMEVMADRIASLLHADLSGNGSTDPNNYSTLNAANGYLTAAYPSGITFYGFCEPLRFLSGTRTEEKNGDWFWGDPNEKGVGRAITLYFGECRRVQSNYLQQ